VTQARVRFSEAAVIDILDQSDWYREQSSTVLDGKRKSIALCGALLSILDLALYVLFPVLFPRTRSPIYGACRLGSSRGI